AYESHPKRSRPSYFEKVDISHQRYRVNSDALRLRESPNGKRLLTFKQGAHLTVTGEVKKDSKQHVWYRLKHIITPFDDAVVEADKVAEAIKKQPAGSIRMNCGRCVIASIPTPSNSGHYPAVIMQNPQRSVSLIKGRRFC